MPLRSVSMKTSTFNFLFFISIVCSLFSPSPVLSQPRESIAGIAERAYFDKLYLHTDRDYYFLGDTIWFKAYYLDGRTQRLLPGYYNLRVELIDKNGIKLQRQLLLLEDGRAPGRIWIPDTLNPGQYLLRAYSDLQNRHGEDHFFNKILEVSKIRSTLDNEETKLADTVAPGIDLAFLPEGGFLLEGRMNTAGIKTLDAHGRSIPVMGEILDQNGGVVGNFDTDYKGMASIRFEPLPGEKYQIRLPAYPAFHQKIEGILKKGIKVELSEASEEQLLFRAVTNSNSSNGRNYLFAIMHRGSLIFQKEFSMKGNEFPIRISPMALPAGINRFILLDEDLVPVSERLYFSKNLHINQIEVRADQQSYGPRSPVTLHLTEMEDPGGMSWSSLSLSVVAANALDDQKKNMDIRSWLLLNSELKGRLESPSEFFLDDEKRSSDEKLELLMLTQGWSNYLWNSVPPENLSREPEQAAGITLTGNVRKAFSKKPVIEGLVVCNLFNTQGFFSEQVSTDYEGRFTFEGLYFPDTAEVFIQGFNDKGKLYTEVFMDQVDQNDAAVSKIFLPVSRHISDFPVRLYQQQYFNDQALRDYALKTGSILLEGVTVKNKYTPVSDGHFRLYAKPRDSFTITEKDYHYTTVFDFLQANVGGIRSPRISFTAGSSGHLILLNGFVTELDVIQAIPMSDIDVIEYVKHYDVSGGSMFGARGANGIVSVFTKKGGAHYGTKTYVQGTLVSRITGFSSYREFYTPVYTPENMDSEQPDHRITLYWNPEIELRDGESTVSFFTSDDYSPYKIIVEGISSTGEVCMGSSEIKVAGEKASLPGE